MQVLWTEGLYLGPQHLQLWERQLRQEAWTRAQAGAARLWGLVSADIDCAGGRVSIRSLSALMPDGTPIDVPHRHPPPAPRVLPTGTGQMRMGLRLALPEVHDQQSNLVASELPHPARYQADKVRVRDVYGDGGDATVDVGVEVLRLVVEGEPVAGLVTLDVAELERDPSGQWVLSSAYVPPCLRCNASPVLMGILRDIHDRLASRLAALQARRETALSAEMAGGGALVVLLAQRLCAGVARLRHALHLGDLSPERVYEDLQALASELSALHPHPVPVQLPMFNYQSMYSCFSAMGNAIYSLMDIGLPTTFHQIDLVKQSEFVWEAELVSDLNLDALQVYLCVRGMLALGGQTKDLLNGIKVSPTDELDFLITRGLRGIEVQPQETPPARLPPVPDGLFLRLRPTGPKWERLLQTRKLGLYLPGRFASLQPQIYLIS